MQPESPLGQAGPAKKSLEEHRRSLEEARSKLPPPVSAFSKQVQ